MSRGFWRKYRVKVRGLDERLALSFPPWRTAILITMIAASACGVGERLFGNSQRWVAAFGGILAVGGVFVSLRPMIRLGGYENWRNFQKPPERVTENYEWIADEESDREEQRRDDEAQQVLAPAMIGLGTLINGISGFFPS